jgi:hypothetical protein
MDIFQFAFECKVLSFVNTDTLVASYRGHEFTIRGISDTIDTLGMGGFTGFLPFH